MFIVIIITPATSRTMLFTSVRPVPLMLWSIRRHIRTILVRTFGIVATSRKCRIIARTLVDGLVRNSFVTRWL